MARKAVGIKDVAKEAGVSVTTVSHVLNDTPHARVNASTRERVLETAKRLQYRPNRLAQGLRTQSSGMVGLLTEEIAATPHAGRIILGAQEAASKHNLTLVIINAALQADADERRDDVLALLDRHVDGIIYATVFHDVVSPPAELRTVPAVLIGATDRAGELPAVVPDEEQGAHDAVLALVAAGHRRIAYAGNARDVPATRGRRAGYERAMRVAGLAPIVADGDSEPAGGYDAGCQLLVGRDRPTAVFCYNDRMAMGMYRAAADNGLHIPGDLSVIGFDDQQPISSGLFPGLTTVALPHYEMGAWAVDALAALMADEVADLAANPLRLPCPLVYRESIQTLGVESEPVRSPAGV